MTTVDVGVLDSVRVLDLSWGIAGPMTTMMLADHGASVTKIEPPGGDPFRSQAGYRVWNRGKRSAVLDLKDGQDRARFLRLAERADVLVESFAPGVTDRLGIDFTTLSRANPQLVYCSITGYGRDTPDSDRPGYDALVQARTGLQWEQRGWPGNVYRIAAQEAPLGDLDIPDDALERTFEQRPLFVASRWPSLGACYQATIGISAALLARERTGRGQWVETSLLQGAIAAAPMVWQRAANPHAEGYVSWYYDGRAPEGFFECSDGRWVCYCFPSPRFVLNAAAGEQLQATAETVDPRNDPDRLQADHFELARVLGQYPALRAAFRRFPSDAWVQLAEHLDIPLSHVLTPREALTDIRFLDDGCVVEINDPDLGPLRHCGVVYHLERSPGRADRPAPRVGQHTDEVIAEAESAATPPRADAPPPRVELPTPLAGIRVLDLGTATAGPFGTQVLSDLGADVIRINSFHDEFAIGHQFICAGRGKRSIAVNLKDPHGQEIVHHLVKTADVVHLNIRLDAAHRLGVDYGRLRAINPRIVYCHTGGYENGTRAALPSNDVIATAVAGVAWADGGSDDGGPPFWGHTALGDIGNGYLSAVAVLQALYDRERTGTGQMVDTSIAYACLLNTSYTYIDSAGTEGETHKTDRDLMGLSATYRLYKTADDWLCLAAVTEQHWNDLCRVLMRPDLLKDPRFHSADARDAHARELAHELAAAFATGSAESWRDALDCTGVPAEISDPNWPLQLFDNPDLISRGWVTSYPHPVLGQFDQHGLLVDLSETPGRVAGPPPTLGQHTIEILRDAGYNAAEITELEKNRVVRQWRSTAGALPTKREGRKRNP